MADWFNTMLVGFDLETTGTDVENDVPVSYAFVNRTAEGRSHAGSLINPGRAIPEAAIAVHGITNERAKAEGASLDDAIGIITHKLWIASDNGSPIVGMNVGFDLKMIDACSRRTTGLSLADGGFNGPVLDILVIDRHYDRYRKGGRKLVDLCAHYGVDVDNDLHDARADVEATLAVFMQQVLRYKELDNLDLDTLYKAQAQWHREWAEGFSSYLVSKGKDPLTPAQMDWPLTRSNGSGTSAREAGVEAIQRRQLHI